MRAMLVYNPGAGGGISPDALVKDLKHEGVDVVQVCESLPDVDIANTSGAELVIVAGGDGTVSRSAIALRNCDLPLAIMPMGTANNIAKTLGLMRPMRELCSLWKVPPSTTLDLGVVQNGNATGRFVEGVGLGLIANTIAAVDAEPKRFGTHEKILEAYEERLRDETPQTVSVTMDGSKPETLQVLLLETLNIASVGSNILLHSDARPNDGYFDVVFAGEADRCQLNDYFRALRAGEAFELKLPTRRARSIRIHNVDQVHVDDKIRPVPQGRLDLNIEPAALRVFA